MGFQSLLSQYSQFQTPTQMLLIFVGVLILASIIFALTRNRKPQKAIAPAPTPAPEKTTLTASAPPSAVEPSPVVAAPPPPPPSANLNQAMSTTRNSFLGRLKNVFASKPTLSAGEMDEIEEILYTSDLGPQTVQRLLDAVETKLKSSGDSGFETVRAALRQEMLQIFSGVHESEDNLGEFISNAKKSDGPFVILVVGVNGAGKTTTIGKLARQFGTKGERVLVAAGDTFRAAAGEQLKVWTERAQVEIFSPEGVTDPSAVAYSAYEKALAQKFDVVIIDTAGRLHTQNNLMEELKKMKRVLAKLSPSAPHETLLVLDANSGQNALLQAREFNSAVAVTGVVLTKLDGTAKGGVAVSLANELKLPIKLIGIGEGAEDLRGFSSADFVDSII